MARTKRDRAKSGQIRLQRRGGRYYFRAKIPKDLIEAYRRPPDQRRTPDEKRSEIVVALGTSDLEEAKLAAQGQSLLLNLEFKAKREELYGAELAALGVKRQNVTAAREALAAAHRRRPFKEVKVVTPAIADIVRLSLIRRLLDADLDARVDPERRTFVEIIAEGRRESIAFWEQCVKTGNTEPYHDAAREEAELHHYRVDANSEGIARLAYEFVQGNLQAHKLLEQREQGQVVDAEAIAPLARTALRERRMVGTSLDDLLTLWIDKQPRPQKTIDVYRADLKEFERFLYDRDKDFAEDITNEDWLDFTDHLQKTQHYKTVMRKIGTVRTVFNWASERRKLPGGNPCSRITIGVPKNIKKPRLPFSPEELQRIFTSTVYTENWRPRGRGGEAFKWLPLLSLWSGAREEELGQLRTDDIMHVEKIGWVIRITDEHPGQTLKTASSRRRVPVHPELLRCGFIDYVKTQREKGHEWLFEQLTPDRYKKRTGSFSKLFMRHLRKRMKITDRTRAFHSFRHSFKTRAGIPMCQLAYTMLSLGIGALELVRGTAVMNTRSRR